MKLIKENMVQEGSTSRTYRHIVNDENFAIISPYRSENSSSQNRSNLIQLRKDVRELGYGYNELIARWVEYDKETEQNVSSDERSLFIHGMVKNQALALGEKYKQSSVIIKDNSGCKEICTTPFSYEEDGKIVNFEVGDVVRTYNISGDAVLNIKDAEEIFSGKQFGPSSKHVKGTRPFKFNTNESLILELWEVEGPRASYFHNNNEEKFLRVF